MGFNREKFVEQVINGVLVLRDCRTCSKLPRATCMGSLGYMAILRCQALYDLLCDALAGQCLHPQAMSISTTVWALVGSLLAWHK